MYVDKRLAEEDREEIRKTIVAYQNLYSFLLQLIDLLNERFGTDFKPVDQLFLESIREDALADPDAVRAMVEEKNAIVFMLADPEMSLRKVDVFLTEALSYENLVSASLALEMPEMVLRVVTIERLLELKRAIDPPRDKDVCVRHPGAGEIDRSGERRWMRGCGR